MKFIVKLYFILIFMPVLIGCGSYINYDLSSKTPAPKYATSKVYYVRGVTYYPQQYYEYLEDGLASHYGEGDIFHGRFTATGERFDKNGISGAHRTLPLPCIVQVINLENGRILKVKINDRGPYFHLKGPTRRIIDLSSKSAKLLGFFHKGTARVRVEVLVDDSLKIKLTKTNLLI